ncbi:hypothetical protein F4859DRAFT_245770 [Xylaria cf. heliscus]|nr:hypothetical protein F4859DRAFT_245770 [Xylaria cf. heliscus]
MVSIQLHLLGIVALAATLAQSNSVNLLNDIPVNTIMDEGTTFVLKWEWDGDATGVGILNMVSFKIGDLDSSMTYRLEDKLNLTMGRYPWVVKQPEGRDTLDWYCSLGINYNNGSESTSGRSFRIRASPSSSTTSATRNATSTSTSTSSASSTGTGTNSTGEPKSGSSSSTSSSNKLPAGAVVGVTVGAIVGAGAFATLIGLVVYYRRKARREKKALTISDTTDTKKRHDASIGEAQYLKPELEAAGAERAWYELDGAHLIREVDASSKPTELDSIVRSELSGDTRRGLR